MILVQKLDLLEKLIDITKTNKDLINKALKLNKSTGNITKELTLSKIKIDKNITKNINSTNKLLRYCCTHRDCNKIYISRSSLRTHKLDHKGIYKCSFKGCNKSFTRYVNAYRHKRFAHLNNGTFTCTLIEYGAKFLNNRDLKDHIRCH